MIDKQRPLISSDIAVLNAGQPFDAFYQWNTGSQLQSIEISRPVLYAVNVRTPYFDIRDIVVIERDIQCGNSHSVSLEIGYRGYRLKTW